MSSIKRAQAVLDALSRALTVETCGSCTFRPMLILDAKEKLTGAWLCPRIGRVTIDGAPKCRHYSPALSVKPADGGGGSLKEHSPGGSPDEQARGA